MKIFSRRDLRNQLRSRVIAPVYLLFGKEVYLRDLAAKTIGEITLKNSSLREFNETEISLNTSNIAEVLAASRQIPMMDARRVIRVTNVVVSAKKSKDNIDENDAEDLAKYLRNPPDSSVVIFVPDELDKRRKVSKLLLEHSYAVEFTPLSDRELIKWSNNKLKEMGAKANERALMSLVACVGDDVRRLTIELEKLATAALPDSLITEQLVESLAPNSRELSNFDLADRLLSNNRTRALSVMKKILDDGAEPLMLLGSLSYNFRTLFMAKEMMDEGVDEKEVSSLVRMPWEKRKRFVESARKIDRSRLEWILKRIAKTDKAIKTSEATPRLQVEMLVCELISG